eukprot:TRINITY_DN33707_c0_g1_i1.p1 TRINITY_DN33707_c0_g1~~TRINITY_DN33707_c0_g1_i1.p1  ORF type:complete len:306 (+),score=121.13 TRINITY_DN33707_c0_g1_i1:101-1018(+)
MGKGCGWRGGDSAATKVARGLLDELMGKERNKPLSESRRRRNHFSDDEYCKNYLCGFCPYMLFTNTKSDLGVCSLNHSDLMREEWERVSDDDRAAYRYEDDFQTFLEDLVTDIDSKIRTRKKDSEAQLHQLPPPDPELVSQKLALEKEIEGTTEEMDRLNEEGRFEDAKILMIKVEQLQQDVKRKQKEVENKRTLETGKILGVCDVCGVLIGIGDEQADARHLVGKQHLGYEQIKNKLRELRETHDYRRELRRRFREKQQEREKRADDAERARDEDRDKRDAALVEKKEEERKRREKQHYDKYRY